MAILLWGATGARVHVNACVFEWIHVPSHFYAIQWLHRLNTTTYTPLGVSTGVKRLAVNITKEGPLFLRLQCHFIHRHADKTVQMHS